MSMLSLCPIDLDIWSLLGSSFTRIGLSYELPEGVESETFMTGSDNFTVEEIEVFAVLPLNNK